MEETCNNSTRAFSLSVALDYITALRDGPKAGRPAPRCDDEDYNEEFFMTSAVPILSPWVGVERRHLWPFTSPTSHLAS